MKNTLVSVDNVGFAYNGEKVLEHISFDVGRGDFLGLIGPNGSGKTTLLRIILGLLVPQEGEVKLFGKPVSGFKEWGRIGYVPQRATYFDTRFPITVAEVVGLGRVMKAGLFQQLDSRDQAAIDEALLEVGLREHKNTPLVQLSGGQQQRVLIAKALSAQPELLILDEPTVGDDVEAQDKFYEELTQLNQKRNLTMILVSHDIDVVVNEVNKLACLNKRLIYHGGAKEFIKGNYLEKLYGKSRRFVLHGH
ncbi:MAG: metal ABC transporter ATP-binding protein [Patescibacteria group bacterium]